MTMAKDPTYDVEEIKKNPVWHAAWTMSECLNDQAPLGWSRYVWVAEALMNSGVLREGVGP